MSSPLIRTKKGVSRHIGMAFLIATIMTMAGFSATARAQAGDDLPAPVASGSPRAGIDIALGNNGDRSYNAEHLSVSTTTGGSVALELYGAGYSGVNGFTAVLELSNGSAVQSITIVPGAFPIKLSEPALSGNTLTASLGDLSLRTTGTDLQLLGTLVLNLSPDLGSGLVITLKTIAFQAAGLPDDAVTANAVLNVINPNSAPQTVSADLNPLVGNQSRTEIRVNPGRSFPIAIYGGNLKEVTGIEIQAQVRSASSYDFSRARFAAIAPFTVVETSVGGTAQGTTVEVDGNTLIAKAVSEKPVSGDVLLGNLSLTPALVFRGGEITITKVVFTTGGNPATLEPNIVLTLGSIVSDAPVVIKPPVPITVTDARAIIQWETNVISRGKLLYGTEPGSLTQETETSELASVHVARLSGLTAGTRYFYQVTNTNAQDRTSQAFPSTPLSFFTRRVADTKAPRIVEGPGVVGITTTRAEVVLITDEVARIDVRYGTSETSLSETVTRTSSQVKHALALEGLTPGAQYFYRVRVTDLSGNDATSGIKRFKTRTTADTQPPRFLSRPSVLGRSFNATVIRWLTDKPSNSAVLYGTDKAALSETVEIAEAVRDHNVALGNLLAGTQYFYQVRSTDASSNQALSEIFDFTTQSDADTRPPKIVRQPIVSHTSDTQAVVVFETNEPTTAALQFDITTDVYDDETGTVGEIVNATDPSPNHEIILTNLTPATRYYFKVSVSDLAGNGPTTRSGLRFATRAEADTQPPVVLSQPLALGIGRTRAGISWVADEPHSAVINYGVASDATQIGDTALDQALEVIKLKTKHLANLWGLEAGTTYVLEVITIDAAGNSGSTERRTFTTRADDDTRAPAIVRGPVARNITSTSVTIEWRTDELSDSRVLWGTSTDYTDAIEVSDGTRVHTVTLTDMEPGTVYHYVVGSADQAGNVVTTNANGTIIGLSKDHTFRTRLQDDTQPPVITQGPIVEFTNKLAVVKWRTDEPATSRVVMGAPSGTSGLAEGTPVFGEASELVSESNELATWHSVTITGLAAGVNYLYQASSTDAAGNTISTSTPVAAGKFQPPGGSGSFTTSTEADTQFPVITRGPTVIGATSSSLTVEWETDESANSAVNFGTSTDNLGDLEVSGTNETTHRMVLTKLAAGTTYAYEVASTDATGNGATRSKVAFGTTPSSVDLTAPVISSGPEVIYKNDRSATVRWNTNEVANSEVIFGTSADNLDNVHSLPEFDTEHTVTLTNLTAGTTYHFRVGSTDQNNNGPVQSAVTSFTTDPSADIQAPSVSDISTIPADNAAVVFWTTDELSDSAVRFGTASGTLGLNTGDAVDVAAHKVTLTNLQPNTTYFYVVESIDQAGNGPTQSAESSFTTVATGDIQAPQPPSGLVVVAGNGAVKLFWSGSPSSGVVGYTIERATAGDFAPLVTIDPLIAYVDQTVENGTAYTYRIAALGHQQLASEASASSDAVTPTADSGPGAPTLYAVQGNPVTPTIAINNGTPLNASDVLSYTFHLATSSEFSDAVSLDAGLAAGAGTGSTDPEGVTAWTVGQSLTNGTTYHYRVKGNDGAFDSAFLTGSFTVDTNALAYPGDINGDQAVGFPDFLLFIGTFNKSAGEDGFVDEADINRDGNVGFPDFLSFIGVFNKKYIKGPSSGKTVVPVAYGVDADARFELVSHPLGIEESGQEIAVDVRLADVSDLRGYGVRINYDPASVLFLKAGDAGDTFLKTGSRNAEIFGTLEHNAEQGEVFIASAITEGESVSGEGVLTTLRFRLLGDPQNALIEIAQGLLIDGKLNTNAAQNLGNRFALVPTEFVLEHNFPNPFNPETTIRYAVPEVNRVTMSVYNVLGQEVLRLVDAQQTPGFYSVRWDGKDALGRSVASGIYLFRMQAGDFAKTNKMLLLK